MKYQISYLSPMGHAKKLAEAFATKLPTTPLMCNLATDADNSSAVHLLGFELTVEHTEAVPLRVIEFLRGLGGKKLFLFVTTPFLANDAMWQQIFNRIAPFVPDGCDFCGIYICPAQPTERKLEELRKQLSKEPKNASVQQRLEQCEKSIDRPSDADIAKGCKMMLHVLGLD